MCANVIEKTVAASVCYLSIKATKICATCTKIYDIRYKCLYYVYLDVF